jgi:hypothetical protein
MADVRTKPEYSIDNRCWDMALTWAIYSLTEPTEYTEKNQKNSGISRRGVGPMGRRLRAPREKG